ncbi:uncharacterized protein LOC105686064 isoform X1 [Athalia rosae]|uniref:uncharacterized protein LOC105686064 isoform X1 n=1 Tax=Athalia rosae TaxID=37344 RepID=UPI0020344586|nr:uncharacterized protein LOC105686064 isoform X1 [Athalia rosae]
MALKLQNCAKGGYLNVLQSTLARQNHTAVFLGEVQKSNEGNQKKSLHASASKSYPSAPVIPLPRNMTQIFGNETGRFTPERARDITWPVLVHHTNAPTCSTKTEFQRFSFDDSMVKANRTELHTDSYDCMGAVSLNSSMQSNVPQPFSSDGKSMHLNMPGGQWGRDDKYIADDMQKSHYAKIKPQFSKQDSGKGADSNIIARCSVLNQNFHYLIGGHVMKYSTSTGVTPSESQNTPSKSTSNDNESAVTKLKRAIKDYGSTVVVFHVGISLVSLGTCYVAISSGVDVPSLVNTLGLVDNASIQGILSKSSTFLIAYGIHKLFAPARISITLATTPFLVRYLRKIGVLKVK